MIKNKYQKYPKYRSSGVEWLGDIPTDWELSRLGRYFSERRIKVSDKIYPPLSVTKKGVVPQLDSAAKSNDGDNRKLVKSGDFVINSRSDRKGSSGISKLDGSVSLINIVMIPKSINPNFSEYLLKSTAFVEENYRIGHGIVADLWTTRYDEMKNIKVAFPPLKEQTAIANFLDDKTAKIDTAIAQKEKMISLLKERKQIIIQNAVTKGLDPDVKMKDSGIEWIGEIPEHWEVIKLSGVCSFVRGNSSFKKDELLSKGKYVALQYGKTYKVDEVDESFEFYVNDEFYKISQIVKYGHVIIISTSETIEDLGHSVFYNRKDIGLLGGEQISLMPYSEMIFEKYLYYSSKIFTKELQKYATGIKVFRFNINDLKTTFVSIPPVLEQKQIVNYIDTETIKIDKIISQQRKQITKLKEYKATLIDSAVTGKIKVPGV